MKKYYQAFIKIGDEEFMKKLFYEGEIYCNTLSHFSEIEYNDKRTDKYDGANFIIQGKNLKVKYNNKVFATAEKCQLYRRDLNLKGNVYCLYGIENDDLKTTDSFEKLNLDLTALNWGDAAVFIYDTKEFLKRVSVALKLNNLNFKILPITYYDHQTYHGKLTPFHKRKELFESQKEIRYWIPNSDNLVQKIYIGSMSDISFIIPKSEINEMEYDFK